MDEQQNIINPLNEYRQNEKNLRLELMNVCKKYIPRISITSIMGVLDLVKQETLELEKVTKSDVEMDRPKQQEQYQY
jgi:FMN-dependent NADH-azoreductase